MECYNLWERGDNLSKQLSWLSFVFYLFQIAGYRYSSISKSVELEEGLVIEGLRTELQKLYREHFFKTICLSGKLAPFYSEVKKEHREESYISAVEYYNYRSAIIKFRIFAHNLPVEKGRWEGIDKTERKCKKCIDNDIGDEKHYILYCNTPDIAKLRTMFFKDNNLARIRSECHHLLKEFWPQVKVLHS